MPNGHEENEVHKKGLVIFGPLQKKKKIKIKYLKGGR